MLTWQVKLSGKIDFEVCREDRLMLIRSVIETNIRLTPERDDNLLDLFRSQKFQNQSACDDGASVIVRCPLRF